MKKALMLLGILMIGIVVITGCGQQTPSINTSASSSQPKGLTITGTVYGSVTLFDNGSNVWRTTRGNPLAGVVLTLSGNNINQTAVTDSSGKYSFTNLPQNASGLSYQSSVSGYEIIATKEGYQRTEAGTSLTSSSGPLPDNSQTTLDMNMNDRPVVLSMSPAPGITVEAGPLVLTVQFSETMDITSVHPTITGAGLRSFDSGTTLSITNAWSNNNKTLTITSGALQPNQTYYFQLDPNITAKDANGNLLDALTPQEIDYIGDTGSQGLSWQIYNGVTYDAVHYQWVPDSNKYYRVDSGGVPGAPSNISLAFNNSVIPVLPANADFSYVYPGTNLVGLHWDTPTTGQISGYRVYVGLSSTGPWNILKTITDGSNGAASTIDDVNTAVFGTTNVDPVCIGKWAFENNKIYFRVVAFNGDGESAAATAEAQAGTGPQLRTKAFAGYVGAPSISTFVGLLNNMYYLANITDGTNSKVAYVTFNEPIDPTTITAANFSDNAGQVTDAALLTQYSSSLGSWGGLFGQDYNAVVRITVDTDFAALQIITVKPGVKDLAGNPVVTGTGDQATVQ